MHLIIDPPVHPYCPPEEVRAWLRELDKKARRHCGDANAMVTIGSCREQATGWLTPAVKRG